MRRAVIWIVCSGLVASMAPARAAAGCEAASENLEVQGYAVFSGSTRPPRCSFQVTCPADGAKCELPVRGAVSGSGIVSLGIEQDNTRVGQCTGVGECSDTVRVFLAPGARATMACSFVSPAAASAIRVSCAPA